VTTAWRRHVDRDVQRRLPVTPTQLTVLDLLSRGLTADAIASRLGVSLTTVRRHVTRLYGRLEAVNAAHAVRRGFDRGLLVPGEDAP
jgi:DNA-binding NarL/FixJ family response regulator